MQGPAANSVTIPEHVRISFRAGSDEDSVPPPDPLIGLTIAERYRILSTLGVGAMGVVYRVEHVRIGKLLAMKLLAGELSHNHEVVERFKREALLASRLSHPNTVQVFDFGQTDGLTYLIMELVPGTDLARLLQQEGPLPFARMAKLVVQICASLAEAHLQGIVHRDLKPENILVVRAQDTSHEIAKVCDFGLAKLRSSTELNNNVTAKGRVVGTPYYMSPEQCRGEDVDARGDIYALGALMYRMLTGMIPFSGANPMAVFAKHLTEAPVSPTERAPELGIPSAVSAIVLKALAKNKEDRFASVQELQQALLEQLEEESSPASVSLLLDPGKSNLLTHSVDSKGSAGDTLVTSAVTIRGAATRGEVDAFERKLTRQRHFSRIGIVAMLALLGTGAYRLYRIATAPPSFDGHEREPNNEAKAANFVPFGSAVQGYVGQRLTPDTSDRDFYAFDVPEGTSVASLRTLPIPNFAICTWLYRSGMIDPIGRFCTGDPGKPLQIDALQVESGRYLIAILQDRNAHTGDAPSPVFENISDPYKLQFGRAEANPQFEAEPNDAVVSATRVGLNEEKQGRLGFVRDVDLFCPDANAIGKARWVIRDALDHPRDPGAVLEASFVQGPKEGVGVLVYRTGMQIKGVIVGPHASDPFVLDGITLASGCMQLRLVSDPRAPMGAPASPPAGNEIYSIRLVPVR